LSFSPVPHSRLESKPGEPRVRITLKPGVADYFRKHHPLIADLVKGAWARYPVDLVHNFVLAHASCNSKKPDRLACADHLNAWVEHTERLGQNMAREFSRGGVV